MKLLSDSNKNVYSQTIKTLYESNNFLKMNKFIQHGDTSCLTHSKAVAYYSLFIADKMGINCDKKSLARAALLHDFFLYDWHEKDKSHRLHGFTHPKTAYLNAESEFKLNSLEKNIIVHHMFPLTLIPPTHRESIIVCLVDKYCSLLETFKSSPYNNKF